MATPSLMNIDDKRLTNYTLCCTYMWWKSLESLTRLHRPLRVPCVLRVHHGLVWDRDSHRCSSNNHPKSWCVADGTSANTNQWSLYYVLFNVIWDDTLVVLINEKWGRLKNIKEVKARKNCHHSQKKLPSYRCHILNALECPFLDTLSAQSKKNTS